MNPADIFEALKGPEGHHVREGLKTRLTQMESRLKSRMDLGTCATEFSTLESALLAVRAGLDTLSRLELTDRGPVLGPLVDGARVIAGEHS